MYENKIMKLIKIVKKKVKGGYERVIEGVSVISPFYVCMEMSQ
jgi:hypothetical protein